MTVPMTNKVILYRLLMVASVTLVVFSILSGLFYLGLFYYRIVFDKLLVMIVPPLAAFGNWDHYRTKRVRFGLTNTKISRRDWLLALVASCAYLLLVFYLFERFQRVFLVVPILAVFVHAFYLGIRTRRERTLRLK